MKRGVLLGIPFYKNPHLVAAIGRSLEASNVSEGRNVHCLFVIDSPDDEELITEAHLWKQRLSSRFKTSVVLNETNVGFVQSANTIFRHAIGLGFDVVLINSDVIFHPETIEEMIAVAESDPMIGFVSPRTNNSTICTFPLPGSDDCDASYKRFLALSKLLPRKMYVPAVVGFFLYCKSVVLRELGLFDTIYSMGYNEENDLFMRANRVGYSCAIANWTYACHTGRASFDVLDGQSTSRDLENAKILNERYPEYFPAIHAYFGSPEHRALQLLSHVPGDDERPSLAFDLSSLGEHYNGTYEYVCRVMRSFCHAYGDRYELHAICSESAWRFHGLGDVRGLRRSAIESSDLFSCVVRLCQPFSPQSLIIPFSRGAVVLNAMLDPIAYDCHYIRQRHLQRWWQFVFDRSDVILYISEFVEREFRERFQISPRALKLVAMPSLNVAEYVSSASNRGTDESYLLVVGNWYYHKHVKQTAQSIRGYFPGLPLKVLGTEVDVVDCESYESGHVAPSVVATLFSGAKAIVLPTFYEGFGLPLLQALAWKKPVIARKIPVFEEIKGHLKTANIHFYESTEQLVKLLAGGVPNWCEEEAATGVRSWSDTASEIEAALRLKIGEVDFDRLVQRLRDLDSTHAEPSIHVEPSVHAESAAEQEFHAMLNSRSKLFRQFLKVSWQKWKHRTRP